MVRSILALIALAFAASLQGPGLAQETAMTDVQRLTIERLYASPSLNGPSPREVKYSPDGSRVTFLKPRADEQDRFDLWAFDVATGEAAMLVDSRLLDPDDMELSEAEKALRERKRIAGSKGIIAYDWGRADQVLVPLGGDLYLVTLSKGAPQVRRLTETEAFEYDARISPGGRHVSFIRDGALYAIELDSGEEMPLSPPAEPENAISYGVAEFVAQEEMSRYTGYWWSPDERHVAFTRVDESTVEIIPRFDIAAEAVTVIEQRYPRAGRPNAVVDLMVRDMLTGEIAAVNWRQPSWGPATDQYLARVAWRGDGLSLQAVDRDQTRIVHLSAAPDEGFTPVIYEVETQERWVNLGGDVQSVAAWDSLLMTSEASGYRHIHVLRPEDAAFTALTEGPWVVDAIAGRDEAARLVYFAGFRDTPLERHLYAVSIDGGAPERITARGRSWSVTVAPDGRSFVATSSSPTEPPQTGLYRADGTLIAWIDENALEPGHPYFPYLRTHTVPDYGTLEAEDGHTLYHSIQLPPDFDPDKRYPVLLEVYGGPHAQTVTRNWEALTDQFYTHHGYIVFRLDNRGSWNRGKAFEDVIHRQTGGPEVADQLAGVAWLKAQPFVDPDRIAIQGWSYGGYMTLMVLLQAEPGTFAAAVSGAPVTDWTLYDTFYTERYMDTPEDNPEGYARSSVFYHLERYQGDLPPLLLIHGMADDNVTFDNTTRLMAALQQARRPFELMTYPGQRHGIRGEDLQVHLMKTRMAFLERHLKAGAGTGG